MKTKKYDGKLLFETWCSWGAAATNPRLIEFANQLYGSASQMGPYYAMWNYMFNHPEETWPLWKEWYFNAHPDENQPTFEEYLMRLRDKGLRNPTVGGVGKNVERFCARYNLDMDYRVNPDDVIQVTRKDHTLFQKLLVVERIDGKQIEAFIWNPDGTRSNHQLAMREFGVVGKTIV